ncbi:copper resistance protein Crd2 [Eremomyces bilateralis CBS 781.70]|uniref:Copper resistance protein Crd2 n=1 Tax=Eremomyces bilateralis CBS 781.70 TaxID=1392243 RepID=A0A6G1G9M2_9PEZI|nr:copper resistance protein Crd2 [Eremomyces bilateralis CBS 781.70]KAF1814723.1 copper resistance protein Crd2 [Eremomyces bilateralis CBS 781.70]
MPAPIATAPPACCHRTNAGSGCICAAEATCSCGKQPALHCNCEKRVAENAVSGATCSCGRREAGHCTCKRSDKENTVPSSTCACGKRAQDSCTCGGTELGGSTAEEIDFTTTK